MTDIVVIAMKNTQRPKLTPQEHCGKQNVRILFEASF